MALVAVEISRLYVGLFNPLQTHWITQRPSISSIDLGVSGPWQLRFLSVPQNPNLPSYLPNYKELITQSSQQSVPSFLFPLHLHSTGDINRKHKVNDLLLRFKYSRFFFMPVIMCAGVLKQSCKRHQCLSRNQQRSWALVHRHLSLLVVPPRAGEYET